jgi:glucosylceramidase
MVWPVAAAAVASGRDAAPSMVGARARVVLSTGDMSRALASQPPVTFQSHARAGAEVIHVNDRHTYQAFLGAGAAMTDTSAWLIHALPSAQRTRVLQSLFGARGLNLNFVRVPIGASDFTAGGVPYTYDDAPRGLPDPGLQHFSIAHDEGYILPTMREALALDPGMFTLASPWTAPAWMKENDRLDNVGHSGVLKPAMYGAFARYIVKFIEAYQREGIHISAVTPQNEPGNPTGYPGMDLDEAGEAALVRFHLAPALHQARLGTEIFGYDKGWAARGFAFALRLAHSRAAADLTGISTHCYFGAPTAVSRLHDVSPKLIEIESECSPGITPYSTAELEISSLRNWASAVALWNLALDPRGGPVQQPNRGCPSCTGVVTINEATGAVTRTLDYYQLGQLAKFVQPGAVRVATDHFVAYGYSGDNGNIATPGLDDVAFHNPDGTDALLAYNSAPTPVSFAIESRGAYAPYALAPHATATFVWHSGG